MAKHLKGIPLGNEHNKNSSGPRLDAHNRLLCRFYEPLALLHILDPNGDKRIPRCPSQDLITSSLHPQELRRTFLEQLAYVCDFVKGGDTVTAIALEAHPSGATYWIASNKEPNEGVILYVHEILKLLGNLSSPSSEGSRKTLEDRIASKCVQFNARRVKAYQTLIRKPLKICLEILNKSKEDEGMSSTSCSASLTMFSDIELKIWMSRFWQFGDDLLGLCRFSYQERGCHFLKQLQNHIGDRPTVMGISGSNSQAFSLARHYIGRLGSHFRAARILVTAGWKMPDLFDNFIIKILPSPKPPSSPPPTDHLTTLDGIIKRMLPKDDPEVKKYQEALTSMDAKFNILDRLLGLYKDKTFKPRVHAELILLECFHRNHLPFVDDDRFIGCSKPACYCCYHYISVHPGGFIRPPCHGVRYLSWRPPDPMDAFENKHQQDILNQIIKQIRLDALRQIEQRRGPSKWHPDSTTGLTYSLNDDGLALVYGRTGKQEETSGIWQSMNYLYSQAILTEPLGHSSGISDLDNASEHMESPHNPEKGKPPGAIKQARYACQQDVPETESSTSTDDRDFSDSDGGVSLEI